MSLSKQPQADAFVASLLEGYDIEPAKRSLGPEASEFQRVIDGKLYEIGDRLKGVTPASSD